MLNKANCKLNSINYSNKMKKISFVILLFSIVYMLNAQVYSIEGRSPKFSYAGRFLAAISNNRPEIYGLKGEKMKGFDGHKKLVMEYCIAKNGKLLVTGDISGMVMVWNIQEGTLAGKYKMPVKTLVHLALSNDGKYIAVGNRKAMFEEIFIFNLETQQTVTKISDSFIGDFKFSPDSKFLIKMSNNELKVWSTQTWTLEKTLKSHTQPITAFDINITGNLVVTVALDKTLKMWDFDKAMLKATFNAHKVNISDVAFHPNGTQVASVADDGMLNFWDIEANKLLYSNDMKGFGRNISFGPEGTLIAISGGVGKYARVKVYKTDELRGVPSNADALVVDNGQSENNSNNKSEALPVIAWKTPESVYVNST
ncbi:MAG TPA: hypothetical protein DCQ31_01050, partial [Bacteroidales bacterium]|nr:hypothetical protein [Bacteroidales bacterium]